jgi:AmmeMemoRadiSam system protein B
MRYATVPPEVREPLVDGLLYPADEEELRRKIQYLVATNSTSAEHARAMVAPTASYDYAGPCMAAAHTAMASDEPSTLIILGGGTRATPDALSIPEARVFQTPLGAARIDEEVLGLLIARAEEPMHIELDEIVHLEEHCIETQIPFIQYFHPRARIGPLLAGPCSGEAVEAGADLLRGVLDASRGSVRLVLSSNLTGYQDRREAEREGSRLLHSILSLDWQSTLAPKEESSLELTDRSAIALFVATVALMRAPLPSRAILCRSNSSRASDDESTTIEYAAVCFTGSKP